MRTLKRQHHLTKGGYQDLGDHEGPIQRFQKDMAPHKFDRQVKLIN